MKKYLIFFFVSIALLGVVSAGLYDLNDVRQGAGNITFLVQD